MKIRICDSDGVYKGGLFKTDSFNEMTCRVWHAPPNPNYDECLIDISGHGNPSYEGSWLVLQVSKHPDITGPLDGSDDFDANSKAVRVASKEALKWFKDKVFAAPVDLVRLAKRYRPLDAALDGEINQLTDADAPLPDGQRKVWDLLKGQALTAKEISAKLAEEREEVRDEAVRKRIEQIKESGRTIFNKRGTGYYRPDAPPPT